MIRIQKELDSLARFRPFPPISAHFRSGDLRTLNTGFQDSHPTKKLGPTCRGPRTGSGAGSPQRILEQ